MSPQSVLAIEYIHILNSAIKTPECGSKPSVPATTKAPAAKPPANNGANILLNDIQIWWWIVFAACIGVLLVVIILFGIYCIINSRRGHSHDCASK